MATTINMPRLLLLLLLTLPAAAQTVTVVIQPPQNINTRPITIYAEVAETPEQRRRGLSHRAALDNDKGMLFRYDKARTGVCMWMKDTHIPLAALFITKNSSIQTIALMQPETLTPHCAADGIPIKYVLEINRHIGREIPPGATLLIQK